VDSIVRFDPLAAGASVPSSNPKCPTAPGVRVRRCSVPQCCRGPPTLPQSPIPTRVGTGGSFCRVPSPPPRFEHPSSLEQVMEFWPFGVLRFTRRNRLAARRSPPPLRRRERKPFRCPRPGGCRGAEEVQVHATKDRDITRDCAVQDGPRATTSARVAGAFRGIRLPQPIFDPQCRQSPSAIASAYRQRSPPTRALRGYRARY
jgi:hypothetical protein